MGNIGTSASTVQIYNNSQTETTQAFCKVLENEIIFIFGNIRIEYVTSTEISRKFPLLVICHNYSRIGTDIDTATYGLTDIDYSKTAVLVVHMRALHALPMLMPTDNLVDEKYMKYAMMVDFAFLPESGLYDCNMNFIGRDKLEKFIDLHTERPTGLPMYVSYGKRWCLQFYRKHRKMVHVGVPSMLLLVVMWFWYTYVRIEDIADSVADKTANITAYITRHARSDQPNLRIKNNTDLK